MSEHWYAKDGTPCYTVIGKNGKERDTTLRDAKKMGLVPSVTTIMKECAKPGLVNWMIDQAIMAALTLPRIDGEDDATFMARVKADSKEQAKKAAERGVQIHAWVQDGFTGKLPFMSDEALRYFYSARKTIDAECGGPRSWIAEKSFATACFGGKCDLHNEDFLIDAKSTDKDISTVKAWDEHAMQLAAYDRGIPSPRRRKCGILYINSNTAESRLVWIPDKDLLRGWYMFTHLTDYWCEKTGLEAT